MSPFTGSLTLGGVRGVRLWNSLPEHVVTEPNYKTFKVLLAEALGDALYDFH